MKKLRCLYQEQKNFRLKKATISRKCQMKEKLALNLKQWRCNLRIVMKVKVSTHLLTKNCLNLQSLSLSRFSERT
jgi:hypothetical protein